MRPGTLHASEVRPADLRGSGPRFASGKCLRHFPRSSAGAGIPTGSSHTPDDLLHWEFTPQPGPLQSPTPHL